MTKIGKQSKHRAVRQAAERLYKQLMKSPIIHAEYRSPARSTHTIDGRDVMIDTGRVFENPDETDQVLSYLALQSDYKSQARLKQLDAYFYGTCIK